MAAKKTAKAKKPLTQVKRRRASAKKSIARPAARSQKIAQARQRPAPAARRGAPKDGSRFPVVAIGASAGGLEAITQLLKYLPADTGMAYVFIQHLDPRHSSQLPEMLGRFTAMPVIEASSNRQIEPDRVYVLPPKANMTISGGVLLLVDRSPADRRPPRPIDLFFESLAQERGQLALGVVLSGTGSDGTLGLTAIKAAGGVTFAQDEPSAQFAGMPSSAIQAGVADFVLPPEAIAEKLAKLPRHAYVAGDTPLRQPPARASSDADALREISSVLKRRTGVDFDAYKRATFTRRVQRRMMLANIDSLAAYADYVLKNLGELDLLFQDVFIHVTSFFRDPETYIALQRKAFPALTRKRQPGLPLRIWVPGCSTGEEVYSVAIAWLEYTGNLREHFPVQIFGTDISPSAVEKARTGRYPETIAANVSPERLRRFFVSSPQGYQVAKPVRELCVFAVHNLLSDPPFTQIDLLCCRNVLIYLEPAFQSRLVQLFHYALRPAGCLVLGPSEDIGKNGDLFTVLEKKRLVYIKKEVTGRKPYPLIPARLPWARNDGLPAQPTAALRAAPSEVWAAADRVQMDKYPPASVIVNEQFEILQVRGQLGTFLEPAHGEPTHNLAKMVRPGLQLAVPNLIRKAGKTDAPARQEGLRLQTNAGSQRVAVEVIPFTPSRRAKERYFLVAFELLGEAKPPATRRGSNPTTAAGRAKKMASLEQDLFDTRASLLAAGEEIDSNAADLRSALEELQSGNEELQSMNEELQTAKEELQSANEELTTLNEEMENRNLELSQALGNLNNLVDSVRLPTLIVGGNMRIRLYNPAAVRVLNIVSTDVGRHVGEIKTRMNVAELEPLIDNVMRTLRPYDQEVQDRKGYWYAMRIRPYQSLDNHIDGAVITWTDISALIDGVAAAAGPKRNLANLAATVRQPLLVLGPGARVEMANTAFYEVFQMAAGDTEGHSLYELADGLWDLPELRRLLGEVLPLSKQFQGLEVDRNFPKIGWRTMLITARRLPANRPQGERTLLVIEDVTAVRQLTELEQLRMLSGRLQTVREEERTRLSREIHDELGGMLTGLKMQLFQLRTGLNDEQAELIQAMSRQIDNEMDFVRRTSASLRPHLLDDMGLVAAMEWQLAEFQKQTDMAVTFRSNVEDIVLPAESQTAAFRIFQEALTNVARHARASAVEVTVEARADTLQLMLHDNGRGISPQALAGRDSLGLVGMRERAQQLGGHMDIRGAPGEGTTVRVRLPLKPADSSG